MGGAAPAGPRHTGIDVFDAHCHIDRGEQPVDQVIKRAHSQGVEKMLISGVDPQGWVNQNTLANDNILMAWGLHPWAITADSEMTSLHLHQLEAMLGDPPVPVVALGETGLDYGTRISRELWSAQAEAFRLQIDLAHQHGLPLVLHVVSAHEPALNILRSQPLPDPAGMVHAFSGSAEIAQAYVALGFHISFCGTIADPRRRKLRRAAAAVPADRLLVETDSPDQTPITRRPGPNEPAFLIDVIAAVAEIRGETPDHVANITCLNAENLFCQRQP